MAELFQTLQCLVTEFGKVRERRRLTNEPGKKRSFGGGRERVVPEVEFEMNDEIKEDLSVFKVFGTGA